MDNATIKWGILGTSFISEVMANAIQESKTSELVAIGSR
ncbi:TPA: gfo/Idh/MocA family oxidoreductase, partial [Legionella pneumophila]|nr:gfo/Idh/MocA family oxidoreductase [Legionella pneumophila]